MKIYHCMNPEENPIPFWMRQANSQDSRPNLQEEEPDLVEQFKRNPNAFFPQFMKIGR